MTEYVEAVHVESGRTIWGPHRTTGRPLIEWAPAQLFRLMDGGEVTVKFTGDPDPGQYDSNQAADTQPPLPDAHTATATVILSPRELEIGGGGIEEFAKAELARKIAAMLLEDGSIAITQEQDQFTGGTKLTARLRVLKGAPAVRQGGDAL